MPWSIAQVYVLLPAFLLVLFRVAGLMLAAPLFSSELVPMQVRALLAGAVSLAIFPMVLPQLPASLTLWAALAGLAGELAIGLLIGLGVTLLFVGVQIAGQVVSQQAGLALGDVFNPMLDTSVTVVSELYFVVALTVFLLAGGDRALVRGVLDSFTALPPLSVPSSESLGQVLTALVSMSFVLAIRVAGPTMLALLLGFVTLGFVSRTVPQLNVLTVGFPIKIAIALLIMALTITALEPALVEGVSQCMDDIRGALGMPAA